MNQFDIWSIRNLSQTSQPTSHSPLASASSSFLGPRNIFQLSCSLARWSEDFRNQVRYLQGENTEFFKKMYWILLKLFYKLDKHKKRLQINFDKLQENIQMIFVSLNDFCQLCFPCLSGAYLLIKADVIFEFSLKRKILLLITSGRSPWYFVFDDLIIERMQWYKNMLLNMIIILMTLFHRQQNSKVSISTKQCKGVVEINIPVTSVGVLRPPNRECSSIT